MQHTQTSEKIESFCIIKKHLFVDKFKYKKVLSTIQSIEGLEYHYNNILKHLEKFAAQEEVSDDSALDHEATAYLNRLGQLYYFLKDMNLLKMCSTIKKLFLFRRKNTGHLSIHFPHKEDKQSEQIQQSNVMRRRTWSGDLSSTNSHDYSLQGGLAEFLTPNKYRSKKAFFSYQILSGKDCANFTPQKDHPTILIEIEKAIEVIVRWETDT